MFQLRGFGLVRWLSLVLLTAFLVVQWSPYAALAALTQSPAIARNTPSQSALPDAIALPQRGADLLAQLHNLPNGAAALPNFNPAEDTFQFSNRELVEAIDVQRNAANWEEVLTDQLQQVFGTQVCIGEEVRTCVLTAPARDWLQTQLERMDLGMAEGMAAAALALWQPDQPQQIPWWQRLINFLVGQVVFGLARNLFDLQTFIANLFLMQGVTEVFQATQDIRNTFTPTQILLTVLDVFLTGSLNPFTMGIYRIVEGILTEGHTLTPYQVEEKGDGKYWIYVYDSNYPEGRANTPKNLHVEFDTNTDTWSYQPIANAPAFTGDAQTKNIDLTRLSWRQVEKQEDPPYRGPFTCPFCRPEAIAEAPAAPTIELTFVGEGQLAVSTFDAATPTLLPVADAAAVVPFRGGLNRAVPSSYRLPPDLLNQPLKITLTGAATPPRIPATLQLTGPGYTANFANLPLTPGEVLTMFVVPNTTGPELTFVTNQAVEIPQLSINLTDDTNAYEFNSSTPATFSITERRVSKSSGFEIGGLKLPAGKRVALTAMGDRQRLYFADDDPSPSTYALTVRNRIVIQDRVQIGERRPDFINYTLTYEEEMRASDVQVEGRTQAFFDYSPTFVDPAERPREELLTAFEQRNFPIAIAYEPLTARAGEAGPLRLIPTNAPPIAERVFQGALRKSAEK